MCSISQFLGLLDQNDNYIHISDHLNNLFFIDLCERSFILAAKHNDIESCKKIIDFGLIIDEKIFQKSIQYKDHCDVINDLLMMSNINNKLEIINTFKNIKKYQTQYFLNWTTKYIAPQYDYNSDTYKLCKIIENLIDNDKYQCKHSEIDQKLLQNVSFNELCTTLDKHYVHMLCMININNKNIIEHMCSYNKICDNQIFNIIKLNFPLYHYDNNHIYTIPFIKWIMTFVTNKNILLRCFLFLLLSERYADVINNKTIKEIYKLIGCQYINKFINTIKNEDDKRTINYRIDKINH